VAETGSKKVSGIGEILETAESFAKLASSISAKKVAKIAKYCLKISLLFLKDLDKDQRTLLMKEGARLIQNIGGLGYNIAGQFEDTFYEVRDDLFHIRDGEEDFSAIQAKLRRLIRDIKALLRSYQAEEIKTQAKGFIDLIKYSLGEEKSEKFMKYVKQIVNAIMESPESDFHEVVSDNLRFLEAVLNIGPEGWAVGASSKQVVANWGILASVLILFMA